MNISLKINRLHSYFRENKWLGYFAIFNRIALAAGFIPSGIVKILGERFTSLSNNHPMGNYLEALHHTGYYYTFIGIMQVTAAILLLIPRTVLLGALIYFPIILNICILSLAVRFDGSLFSSPLMVLADLYLLWWNYDKLKFIFLNRSAIPKVQPIQKNNRFPWNFFAGVVVTFFSVILLAANVFEVMPRNTLAECKSEFQGTNRTIAGDSFCECIHTEGAPLDKCLNVYNKAPDDEVK